MKVTILSSQNTNIDEVYLNTSQKIIDYLTNIPNIELNWGSGTASIMGLCYEAFSKKGLPIHGFTTPKYIDLINDLPNADHKIYDNTFLLKQHLYQDTDFIVILPGGIGTVSELLSFLEEARSNDDAKPIIIYNETGIFDSTINLLNDLINNKFNNPNVLDYLTIANNLEEFDSIIKRVNS
ncbi:MAG: LOG family protein [Bacilli bacterium]|nr:LOG family protein [Bacilli bacterium]